MEPRVSGCRFWYTVIYSVRATRNLGGLAALYLLFYRLEILGEREDRGALLRANLFPWISHVIAKAAARGKQKGLEGKDERISNT